MKYQIEILKLAQKEINKLTKLQQNALAQDLKIIETKGIEFVKRRHLIDGIFEIKTNDVRALFKYEENQIILIGLVYEKKTKKAPVHLVELAKKRLEQQY